ncbi:MAG: hypothetical protein QOD69_2518 [Solirubrobacteraceae bacterium]|nr:hypothetical protein [Solirubrobacteraceae bacterium]
MKVLFCMGHDGFIRNFEPVLRGLAEQGHEVRVALSGRRPALMSGARTVEELCAEVPNLSWCRAAKGRDHDFTTFEDALNTSRDYIRFNGPAYRDAHALRARARQFAPPPAARLADLPGVRSAAGVRILDRALRALQRLIPVSAEVAGQLAEERPDVVLVTPLIGFRSRQVALVRAARAAGVPSALLVHSWDNLTNKGVLHELPDRVIVWNEPQREEAVALHGVPRDRVIVTGAQSYDHWFDWEPATERGRFCGEIGLDAERPFVLYVCSSSFIAPDEVRFLRRWLAELRAVPALRDIGVLVRPHPQHLDQWRDIRLDDPGRSAVWPGTDADRSGRRSREQYYDSIHHAAAVVGINTSALIESAIQRRPVLTVLEPQFRATQSGTLHFSHLAADDDGLLIVGRSMGEHLDQLAAAVDAGADPERTRRFLERFVRPRGLDLAATPAVLAAIEDVAAARRAPHPQTRRSRWLRGVAAPLARVLRRSEARLTAGRRKLGGESR